MKKYFTYFLYISLAFLVLYLFKLDYLQIPKIVKPVYLILSFFSIFSSFIFLAVSWQKLLNAVKIDAALEDAVKSMGLSIFGKYIPGKIWLIIGRAAYLNEKFRIPLNRLASFSLTNALMSLWTGITLAAIGLIFIQNFKLFSYGGVFIWILLTLFISFNFLNIINKKIFIKLFKKDFEWSGLNFRGIIRIIHWYVLDWLLRCIGFYLLTMSMVDHIVPIYTGLGFALAVSMGVITVFAPGGIGVREGVLIFFLTSVGLDLKAATTISFASRVWFMCGELFIFLMAVFLEKYSAIQSS